MFILPQDQVINALKLAFLAVGGLEGGCWAVILEEDFQTIVSLPRTWALVRGERFSVKEVT